ncbi:SHOCT domain-containing protein, partial [Streptomyces sp. WAC 04229]|uniref:SHOCT domain-containing protein n=1 Tax=Streptomyces sp. WAC 04229 TaxID=2203206 RepID=UPI0021ADBB03
SGGHLPDTAALKFLPTGTGTPRQLAHLRDLVERENALLRRLRELGELHRSGVLTDEEFNLAKQAVLKRF